MSEFRLGQSASVALAALAPIAALCLLIGLYSPGFTKVAEPEIRYIASMQQEAIQRNKDTAQRKAAENRTAERAHENE